MMQRLQQLKQRLTYIYAWCEGGPGVSANLNLALCLCAVADGGPQAERGSPGAESSRPAGGSLAGVHAP